MVDITDEERLLDDQKRLDLIYKEDGYGNSGVPDESGMQRLLALLEDWIKQFRKDRDDYGNRTLDDSDDIVNYETAKRSANKTLDMATQGPEFTTIKIAANQMGRDVPLTEEYAKFCEEYAAFPPAYHSKVMLPETMPAFSIPPSRADAMHMLEESHKSKSHPAPEPQLNVKAGTTKIKDLAKSGDGFVQALEHVQDGDPTAAKAAARAGFEKLAEKAYDAAIEADPAGPASAIAPENTGNKKSFVKAFMASHEDVIASLERKIDKASNPLNADKNGTKKSADDIAIERTGLESELANLSVVAAHPESVINGVKSDLKGLQTNGVLTAAGQSLSTALVSMNATRMTVRHIAGNKGHSFEDSLAAGNSATSQIAQGKDEKIVLAESRDKPSVVEDKSDLGRKLKAAEYLVLTEAIERVGPISMKSLKDKNGLDHKGALPQNSSMTTERSRKLAFFSNDPKLLHLSETATVAYIEKQAIHRMDDVSREQVKKSEAQLANAFGEDGKATIEAYLQTEHKGLKNGKSIEDSEERLKYALEKSTLAIAMNKDPAIKEIAIAALKNAPEGQNPAQFALAQVREAQELKYIADTNHDGKIDRREALAAANKRANLPETPEKSSTDRIFDKLLAHVPDIREKLQKARVDGVVTVAVSRHSGTHAEGQNAPSGPANAPSSQSRDLPS